MKLIIAVFFLCVNGDCEFKVPQRVFQSNQECLAYVEPIIVKSLSKGLELSAGCIEVPKTQSVGK